MGHFHGNGPQEKPLPVEDRAKIENWLSVMASEWKNMISSNNFLTTFEIYTYSTALIHLSTSALYGNGRQNANTWASLSRLWMRKNDRARWGAAKKWANTFDVWAIVLFNGLPYHVLRFNEQNLIKANRPLPCFWAASKVFLLHRPGIRSNEIQPRAEN